MLSLREDFVPYVGAIMSLYGKRPQYRVFVSVKKCNHILDTTVIRPKIIIIRSNPRTDRIFNTSVVENQYVCS